MAFLIGYKVNFREFKINNKQLINTMLTRIEKKKDGQWIKIATGLLFFVLLTAFSGNVYAQKKITGSVTEENGEPAVGASVALKGTTRGTITDVDGKFDLDVPEKGTLQISYLGYSTMDVAIEGKNVYNIVLKEKPEELEELVVLGYSSAVQKKSFTGSASTIKSDELIAIKNISPTQGLQGRASGVNVTTSSGMPGAPTTIRVRGVNSISSGKDPLWIIDGVPLYSGGGLEASNRTTSQDPMSMLNANDIESMEILKDAAATAIYGSRGTNGVIIITTKSGKKSGAGSVTIDFSTGLSNLTRTHEDIGFASSEQWIRMADLAYQYQTQNPDVLFEPSMVLSKGSVPFSTLTREQALATNSNWFDQVLRTGTYTDVNLNLTRGFEKGSVYSSFNYRKDEGVLDNNDFTKFTGRINADYEVIKNLTTGSNMSFAYSENNRVKTGYAGSIGGGGGTTGAFEAANRNALPWMPIYDDENPTGYWSANAGNLAANNDRRFLRDYVHQYRVLGNAFAELNIAPVKGLSVRTEVGIDYINNSSVDWRSDQITSDGVSYTYDQNVNRFVLNYNAFLKYNQTFGIHSISAVGGMESMQMKAWTRKMEGKELVGQYPELGRTNPATMLTMNSYFSGEDYLLSYFLRADYRLLDKYVLALSLRTDGSSKFDADKRWGKFIALSGGWILSEEVFFEDLRSVVNLLKLKASYGQTGNNSVPNGIYETAWSNATDRRYGAMDYINAGTILSTIGNKSATWETTNNFDAGIDYGFLNNKISGSIDYYYKKVSDMLLKASLPVSSGITGGNSIWANVGDMANYGVDFSITSVNIDTKDFRWSTTLNLSYNRNKILGLTPDLDMGGKGMDGGSSTRIIKGHRYGTFFMADYAGIDPEKGVEMIWEIDVDRYNETGETVKTGNKIPATTDNVGTHRYLFEDKTIIPSYYGGFNNTFNFRGFDANIFFTFSGGNYIYDYNLKRASYVHNGQTVLLADVNESTIWAPGKTDAKYPIQSWNSSYPGADWNTETSDWNTTGSGNYNPESANHSKFMYKGDYLRLKNVSVGYTLPKKITEKIFMQQLRIYVQATNLWTLTDYPGYDPEGATWIDSAGIPNLKTYSFGLTAKF